MRNKLLGAMKVLLVMHLKLNESEFENQCQQHMPDIFYYTASQDNRSDSTFVCSYKAGKLFFSLPCLLSFFSSFSPFFLSLSAYLYSLLTSPNSDPSPFSLPPSLPTSFSPCAFHLLCVHTAIFFIFFLR